MATSAKNLGLSVSSQMGIGAGDILQEQTDDEIDARRKKLNQLANQSGVQIAAGTMTPSLASGNSMASAAMGIY